MRRGVAFAVSGLAAAGLGLGCTPEVPMGQESPAPQLDEGTCRKVGELSIAISSSWRGHSGRTMDVIINDLETRLAPIGPIGGPEVVADIEQVTQAAREAAQSTHVNRFGYDVLMQKAGSAVTGLMDKRCVNPAQV